MVRLTNEQAIDMMKAKLECMTRSVRGVFKDCNNDLCDSCEFNYSQGNMGEQQEWLRMGIKALENQKSVTERREQMSDLISRESLKQRIKLNYNSHQYISAQSMKDIINTEPPVEDKTVEELEKIKSEIKDYSKTLEFINHTTFVSEEKTKRFIALEDVEKLITKPMLELKGK